MINCSELNGVYAPLQKKSVHVLISKWFRWFKKKKEKTHLPMQETQEIQVAALSQEYPLEKGMAIHSSIRDWRIPWTEGPGGLQSMGSQRVRHD